jgi:oligoribonuclease
MTNRYFDKLFWVDIEFTNLDATKSEILEFAAVVTDVDLNEIVKEEWLVHQADEVLETMKNTALSKSTDKPELDNLETVYDLHEESGLIDKVKKSKTDSKQVEAEVVNFVKDNIGENKIIMAGNSIHVDRTIIKARWPRLDAMLHYRMVDVSSFKLIYSNTSTEKYTKQNSHRALDDIKESIAELKFYLSKR